VFVFGAANGETFATHGDHPSPLLRHRGEARAVAIRDDGVVVTAGADAQVMLYERDATEPFQSVRAGTPIWCVDVDDRGLVAGGDDGRVHVFRLG